MVNDVHTSSARPASLFYDGPQIKLGRKSDNGTEYQSFFKIKHPMQTTNRKNREKRNRFNYLVYLHMEEAQNQGKMTKSVKSSNKSRTTKRSFFPCNDSYWLW